MHYEIPLLDFEEMIGQGLWVGHQFVCNGQRLILTEIGQAQETDGGARVVPVQIERDPVTCLNSSGHSALDLAP